MKKLIITLGVLTVSLTSCLKDKPNVDFSNLAPFAELVHSGLPYFGSDAITDAQDDDGFVSRDFSINVTGEYPPNADVSVTIAVDNTLTDAYNTANPAVLPAIPYIPVPADAYSLSATSAVIKKGTRLANFTIKFDKTKLDPSKSYMLPVKMVTATGGGVALSANFSIHYFHFIGNDFGGPYTDYYTRWESNDTTKSAPSTKRGNKGTFIFNPITPVEFTVSTYYFNQPRYDVTFTKTGSGATATYSDFKIKFYGSDVADLLTPNNISIVDAPKLLPADYHTNPYDATKQYTKAEALKLFRFYYTTASRGIIDEYVAQ